MKHHLKGFLTALRFLTIVPLHLYSHEDRDHFIHSVKFFSVIGLLIGIITLFLCKALSLILPHVIVSLSAILLLAGISGFLHLDGLADTADGFFSARPKEKILEIMRDSRIGAMGVIVLFFALAFKFSALASLSTEHLLVTVFYMPLAGRCAILLTMTFLPYARNEGGLGGLFYGKKDRTALLLTLLLLFFTGYLFGFAITSIVILTMIATFSLVGIWCKKMIGGATGDTLGAVCEITETSVAVVLAGFFMNFQQ